MNNEGIEEGDPGYIDGHWGISGGVFEDDLYDGSGRSLTPDVFEQLGIDPAVIAPEVLAEVGLGR